MRQPSHQFVRWRYGLEREVDECVDACLAPKRREISDSQRDVAVSRLFGDGPETDSPLKRLKQKCSVPRLLEVMIGG